jgi:hypothetical protein
MEAGRVAGSNTLFHDAIGYTPARRQDDLDKKLTGIWCSYAIGNFSYRHCIIDGGDSG